MDFSGIQAEKAKAMMRYRRLRNVARMWPLLEVLVALVFLSWSSIRLPVAVKLSGESLAQISVYLFNPHVNFVIGNAIIILLVLLSRQNDARNNAGSVDLHDDYVQDSEDHRGVASVSDQDTQNAPPRTSPETEETAGAAAVVDDDEVIVVSDNAVTEMPCDAVSTAIEEAAKQIQRFRRTQSQNLKRDLGANRRRRYRRSETEILPRSVAATGDEWSISSFDTVDRLSSEDFRRTIEAFIAKQQRFLWAQKMAEQNQ